MLVCTVQTVKRKCVRFLAALSCKRLGFTLFCLVTCILRGLVRWSQQLTSPSCHGRPLAFSGGFALEDRTFCQQRDVCREAANVGHSQRQPDSVYLGSLVTVVPSAPAAAPLATAQLIAIATARGRKVPQCTHLNGLLYHLLCSAVRGSWHKRQKAQAPTPQAPIRNRQTRKVANAKVRNRYTNLT